MTSSAFGSYVSQVGRIRGVGAAGWVFKVNGISPPVGADQVVLKDGDEVLWYYATFGADRRAADALAEGGGRELLRRHHVRRPRQGVPRCGSLGAGRRAPRQGRHGRQGLRGSPRRARSCLRRRRGAVERREVSLLRCILPFLAALALAGCGGEGPTAADGTATSLGDADRGSEVLVDAGTVPAGQTSCGH